MRISNQLDRQLLKDCSPGEQSTVDIVERLDKLAVILDLNEEKK